MAKTAKPATKRKPHDMGGDAAGPVDRHEHAPSLAERRIDAMMLLLRNDPRGFWVTDENRRTIESLTPATYRDTTYYEKWCMAMRSLLIEKGVLGAAEIDARLAQVRARYGLTANPPRSGKATARKTKSSPAKATKGVAAKPRALR